MSLPRSTFYASKKTTGKQAKDAELVRQITEIQNKYFYTIGRRRMGSLLKRRFGTEVCETTLQRVMNRHHLGALIRRTRKARPQAGKATQQQLPDNMLNRQFCADKPMFRLVTDVTYIPYFENGEWHWGYLSLVQDLFDRSIAAWVFSRAQDTALAVATLQILSFRKFAPGAMLHSDRGSIYTSEIFRQLLADMGVTQSFSRTANCYDNATMESFNGTFKVESLYNSLLSREKPSFQEQNDSIAFYIDFYNNRRPCSVIGNVPPSEYRQQRQKEKQETVS